MDPQGISPLPVVPPRYPHLPMRELITENLNFNPLQEVPLYQMHSRGRQRMQYAEMARGIQFSDWAGARPPTTNMHCRRGWTVATESYDGIGCSGSVEETSQFPEQNQGRERMRASRFLRQQTLDRSVNEHSALHPNFFKRSRAFFLWPRVISASCYSWKWLESQYLISIHGKIMSRLINSLVSEILFCGCYLPHFINTC